MIGGGFFGTKSATRLNITGQASVDAASPSGGSCWAPGWVPALLTLFAQIMLAGIYRGALRVMDGEGFSLGQLFQGYNKMQVVFAAIFIAVATGIATVLCFLPGILIAFLTSYTLFFIVDQQLEAAEAIAASVKMVWHNFGHALLFFILAAICVVIGAHRCSASGCSSRCPSWCSGRPTPTGGWRPPTSPSSGRPAPAAAPPSRRPRGGRWAARVRVQPVTTWSSTSSTGPRRRRRPRAGSAGRRRRPAGRSSSRPDPGATDGSAIAQRPTTGTCR